MMRTARHARLEYGESRRGDWRHPPVSNDAPSRPHGTRNRGGWTLIEMLVTIAVMGSLTGIAVQTLTAMLRSERNGVEHVARLATVPRLARQFRADIHAAVSVEVAPDMPTKPLLLVTISDARQIQYDAQPEGLWRTERRANRPPLRQLWRLKQTRFQCMETTRPPRLLTLVIGTLEPDPIMGSTPTAISKELRIDAVVGRARLGNGKQNQP